MKRLFLTLFASFALIFGLVCGAANSYATNASFQ
jgi:hypothetical protein